MDLLSFMSSFKCCKNFPLKINFFESNFLEVYAVVHYTSKVCIRYIVGDGRFLLLDSAEPRTPPTNPGSNLK